MRADRRLLVVALWLLLGSMPAAGDADPAAAIAEEPPSMALLEFLGEWETQDGEWIDPTVLEEWPSVDDVYREESDETD